MSQESLSIARGESKLISAYSKPVYAGITFANSLYAELVEKKIASAMLLANNKRLEWECNLSLTPRLDDWMVLVPPVRCYGNCMISSVVLSRDVLFSAELFVC